MIRITRLTDYAIMLLTFFARDDRPLQRNARELSEQAHLPLPTVSKILKVLAKKGLLHAHRGAKGGFALARKPEEITVAEIVNAVEGSMAMTQCSHDLPGLCELESLCPVQSNWQKITRAVHAALGAITLADMSRPMSLGFTLQDKRWMPMANINAAKASGM